MCSFSVCSPCPVDEAWDIAFIARYPTLSAFLEMVTDPAYQAVVYHRQAAVADSRFIAHYGLVGAKAFG
jgi:uncharacterized protein (DUF1330 family)